jgi:hypothetical protein
MTPPEQLRKLVDSLNKQPKQPTGGDGRITAEVQNTSAIAKGQAASNTKKPAVRKPSGFGKDLLGEAIGVGTGIGGFVKGMTHSEPAQAQVLDVTMTNEYRNAQDMARKGMKPLFGEDPKETLKRLETQQAAFDNQYHQMTGATPPTDRRILRETNRFNPKAR